MTWTFKHSPGRTIGAFLLAILVLYGSVGYGCEALHGHDCASQAEQSACVCICICHDVMVVTQDHAALQDPLPVSQKHPLTNETAPALAFVLGVDRPPEI